MYTCLWHLSCYFLHLLSSCACLRSEVGVNIVEQTKTFVILFNDKYLPNSHVTKLKLGNNAGNKFYLKTIYTLWFCYRVSQISRLTTKILFLLWGIFRPLKYVKHKLKWSMPTDKSINFYQHFFLPKVSTILINFCWHTLCIIW